MTPPDDPLDRALGAWNPPLGDERRLRRLVRNRIEGAAPESLLLRFWGAPGRLAWAAAFLIGCILAGFGAAEFRAARAQEALNVRLARQYLSLVDPLAGAKDSSSPGSVADDLAWMRSALHLTPEQFARIRALHESSAPGLRALAAEVARLRSENAALEQERRAANEVDFLAFSRLLETRRQVDQQCADSTRRLVAAAATVMTAEQRRRYLNYVEPELLRARSSAAD